MNRLIFIMLSFLFVAFSGNICEASDKGSLKDELVHGKWMNRADGYIPKAIRAADLKPDQKARTVARYKVYSFYDDGTFTMDSIKQRYTGTWQLEGNKVIMTFNPKKITEFSPNLDPNASGQGYVTTDVMVNLGIRTATINGDVLEFSNPTQNAYHNSDAIAGMKNFWEFTGFPNATTGNLIMIIIALIFIWLAIRFDYEPMLLIPIGMGIIIGNIPFYMGEAFNLKLGIYEPGSVLNILYSGVINGWYPPLIFLGIGAMTDFSSLISNPRLMLLGAAAQLGIFVTFLGALWLGFAPPEAGAIGIIGGADGPTAIFLSSKLANGVNMLADGTLVKNLIGPIAIAAYSYMALVPVIQPPVINLLTTKHERKMLNSTCKCNRILINNLFKYFVWREVSKSFTRSIIEFIFNPLNLFVGYFTKVLTLWDILPDKPVGVFIGTTFP
ncbi:sodium ion-translocating decarboxylase, beta subunit [Odoribacter laneus YIT 12061]|uniref:Sodium ion-translocating decarboxylase, beta subunit n=1 Tax=Odoribacter laneus YIT 12061 TaxID=742817 RepID=H1DGX0_9BACT|nr:sodium ion-translocating decarboxylase, beta subunit [Odoribacter laneus YIT 12061]